jgi:hypothetical protein
MTSFLDRRRSETEIAVHPILAAAVLAFSLACCDTNEFTGLPREGVFREVTAEAYGRIHLRYTFDNYTSEPIDLPAVERSCGCLEHKFSRDRIEPGGSVVMTLALPVKRRGRGAYRVRLIWKNGAEVHLGAVVQAWRLRGLEISTDELSAEDWMRSGRMRVSFLADYLVEPVPFGEQLESSLRLRVDGSPVPWDLLSVRYPAPEMVSGEVSIPVPPLGLNGAREFEIEVPGLDPVRTPIVSESTN